MQDYEEHVWDQYRHEDGRKKTWCGRNLDTYEFNFLGANHAALSIRQGMTTQPCPECARAIIAQLQKVIG